MKQIQVDQDALIATQEVEALRADVNWVPQSDYERIMAGSYRHFSIRNDSRLIGFLNVISDRVLDALLVDLMVHPSSQKQGLGRALVTEPVTSLKGDAIRYIQVIFNPVVVGFCRRCGFTTFQSVAMIEVPFKVVFSILSSADPRSVQIGSNYYQVRASTFMRRQNVSIINHQRTCHGQP